jgi:rubrerythrin
MATKKEVQDVANKGNWFYSNAEYRCEKCGEYQFTGKHEDDCPVGILLKLIEDSDLE